ncbi:bifunctional 2-C-methyl-D-erythritol 4-phosphate cytidylyltransferase/2-C-methyl-D-erythritol 2,4-cyclodiphosphate synthase [Novosphingobium jiangmenense]|uniref:Bifunctional enzyme IspD/IspF n=1 Tax=Novosphingobium jiangmenense TaxID=2791981 RepID=A0ABS0HDM8_9SPHN|nr:bifunctional 2-C-methyl-D-erythritol 4-phosphate cytidylyltransferase/2-C-methyl-D-erythritol 2,4-cyclodiphosphate synthase [Novosphingobium jiangmenense]MBF9150066.1 bifunctional 2-C-methyl-D-erythritol 4-phosphate cytidylyltransferase/2-C-methyl-D-erythritol 2,4-cyclodiphosphate synthase [Novosphingobium jiangmenense]
MSDPLPSRTGPVAAIVVAAGKGSRTGGTIPKQFVTWRGKPLVRHSVEALVQAGIAPIVVAIPQGFEAEAAQALDGLAGIKATHGGTTRQDSVRLALEALEADAPTRVLIHDAARPVLPQTVIAGLLDALDRGLAAIPVLPVVDSMIRGADHAMAEKVVREELFRVQTPQAFDYAAILAAHRAWTGKPDAGDDAQVAVAAGITVLLADGDEALRKITFAADLEEQDMTRIPRTGMGFDVHRLVEGEELWLCGVKIAHSKGLSGHSDADVAIHALVDALLGAIAMGDIGDHFPPSDPQWKGASSDRFLAHAAHLVREAGYEIGNVDVTIICEAPKIGPHKSTMREALARILGIDSNAVSVKATTTERLGLTGRGEGIAAQAVATVVPR